MTKPEPELRKKALLRLWICCALATLSLLGCKDAKKFVNESKEGYRVAEEMAGQVRQIASSLSTNDFVRAKEFAVAAERHLSTRVLSWTVQILATEEKEGVDAAKASIERFKATDGITTNELAALVQIDKFYQQKGSDRTGDLLVLIAAFAVEQKYGHGAGGLLLRICETYRWRRPASTNAPAQSL